MSKNSLKVNNLLKNVTRINKDEEAIGNFESLQFDFIFRIDNNVFGFEWKTDSFCIKH